MPERMGVIEVYCKSGIISESAPACRRERILRRCMIHHEMSLQFFKQHSMVRRTNTKTMVQL